MRIEELVQFIEQREPGYKTKIRGSDDGRIEDLLEFLPGDRKLPKVYEAFLKALGENAASFLLLRGEFLAYPLWFHLLAKSPSYPQSRYFKFGVDEPAPGVDVAQDWFLDLERMNPTGDDAVVVRFEDEGLLEDFKPQRASVAFASFRDMLRDRTVRQYVLGRLSTQSRLFLAGKLRTPERERVGAKVIELLVRQGLHSVLDSSPQLWTGETADGVGAAIVCIPPALTGVEVYLGGANRKAVVANEEILRDHIDGSGLSDPR